MNTDGIYNIMSPDPIGDNRSDWSGFGRGVGLLLAGKEIKESLH